MTAHPPGDAESWNGGRVSCNSFSYRFEQVQLKKLRQVIRRAAARTRAESGLGP